MRCYSLSGAPEEPAWRISVERIGTMSTHLHGLRPGDRVEVLAPKGGFHLDAVAAGSEALPRVLVAGGIGITPLLAMLHEAHATRRSGRLRLLYAVRRPGELAFGAEIRALQQSLPDLQVTTFVEQPDGSGAFDRSGRCDLEALLGDHGPEAHFFLGGPAAMMQSLRQALATAGVPPSRVHAEAFGPASRPAPQAAAVPRRVSLARSGRAVSWQPAQGSLLDQLQAAGAVLGSGCRSGQCESCAMRLLEGEVEHPEGTARLAAGRCLPCVAMPLTDLVLDL